jgi:CRP-like cAMP-binding protein
MIGRWSEDEFAAILEVDPAAALAFSREAVRKLSGTYSVQENGLSRNVELQVAAGVTDSQSAGDPANFYRRLAQLAEAISGS